MAFFLVFLMPLALLAQTVADPISDSMAFDQILANFKGQHLVGLAKVAAIVQSLMFALRSEFVISRFGDTKKEMRLALVYSLSTIGGVLELMLNGMAVHGALLHSSTLAAYQVLCHQIYTVYIEKKQKKD